MATKLNLPLNQMMQPRQPQGTQVAAGGVPRIGTPVLTMERGMNRPGGDQGYVIGRDENGMVPVLRIPSGRVDMVPVDQLRIGGSD